MTSMQSRCMFFVSSACTEARGVQLSFDFRVFEKYHKQVVAIDADDAILQLCMVEKLQGTHHMFDHG